MQLAPGTSFSLQSISRTSQCDKSKLVFTLLVQIKLVAKTVQTNAKKNTLIIHFHSALDKVVIGVYKMKYLLANRIFMFFPDNLMLNDLVALRGA